MDRIRLLLRIERLRKRLNETNPEDRDELQAISRRLDRLIVQFLRGPGGVTCRANLCGYSMENYGK
ncbi:MAG TPA: Spo0E family sporulation regulatory protein-aspartic acid phosphatase [Desulfotomaculum sp.]|nr:Spo0E family sporulation regulatory protein-aspartic acid phosphatase [Desulfotomaculum sp.]